MTKPADWKRRREHVFPGRVDYVRRRLAEVGVSRIKEEGYDLFIDYKGRAVRYNPFTGTYQIRGKGNGRGLENLIKELS